MPFDSKEDKIEAILFDIEQLAMKIRYDQKRKKILFGDYQSRIETIREMLDKEFQDVKDG